MKRCLTLVLILALAGCATGAGLKVDPITLSADTAAIVGEQAVSTNLLYTQLCAAGTIPAEKCRAWADFFTKFKADYALAHLAFSTSLAAGQVQTAQEAAARIQTLATQLVIWTTYGKGVK